MKEIIKRRVQSMISVNPYYTQEDIEIAWDKAMYIYKNIYSYNINGYLFDSRLLKNGNHKLGKTVLQWDLPSVITCNSKCKGCYAMKAERIYKNTRVMRLRNLILIELALVDAQFSIQLINYIVREARIFHAKKGCNVLRLHSSGDIYCNQYMDWLLQLVIRLNGIYNVYTYTKQLDNTMIDNINQSYDNFNIVKSFVLVNDKKYINFGTTEYIQDISTKLKNKGVTYHICDYGNTHQLTCMGNCKACLHCDTVLFKQH